MSYHLLSLSQSPPLWVPLRFFVTAPLFLLAAGLILLFAPDNLFATRWSPLMLALTHLLTLGFLGLCMVGAIQQLIPVLAGVSLPMSNRLSQLLFGLWSLGTILLVSGMAMRWEAGLQGGALMLVTGVLILVALGLWALWRSGSRHDTVPAMGMALLALLVSVGVVLWLLWAFQWHVPLAHPYTRLHIGWAALGWIALLVMGVAYQVVPMFQLTGPYPLWLRRALAPSLAGALLLWSVWPNAALAMLPAMLLALFALYTLYLQQRRRRQLADATLDFWRIAMGSLLLVVVTWLVWLYRPDKQLEILLGVLFLAGFATAAVNGMLYKIVPFLIWLNLNNQLQQAGLPQSGVPNMKQIIPQRHARRQLWLYLLALVLLALTVLQGLPTWPAGLAWLASTLYLQWNLVSSARLYRARLAQSGL